MSVHELQVENRPVTGKEAAKRLRREGKLPAVLYGHGETPVSLSLSARALTDLLAHHGSHSLVTLSGAGNGETAIIKAVQRHPFRGVPTTVDFQRVSATEKITVTLPLVVEGEPLELRTGEGTLVQSLHELHVRAVSTQVPEAIHVDISKLELNGPALHVGDLVLPAGVEVLNAADEAVAALNSARVEAVEEPATPEAAPEEAPAAEETDSTE